MIFPEKLLYVKLEVKEEKLQEVLEKLSNWKNFHIDLEKGKGFGDKREIYRKIEEITSFLGTVPIPTSNVSCTLEINALYEKVIKLKEKLKELEWEEKLLKRAEEVNRSFKGEISKLTESLRLIKIQVGTFKKEVYPKLSPILIGDNVFAVFSPLPNGEIGAVFFLPPNKTVDKLSSNFNVRFIPLKYFDPKTKREIEKRKEKLQREIERLREEYGTCILNTYSLLKKEVKLNKIVKSLERVKDKAVIKGWIPEKKRKEFEKLFGKYRLTFLQSSKTPPTLIKTPPFLKPIEEIVFSYSYPSYDDVNPVFPFISVFLLLFGIMFGDLGHGILLSLAGFFVEKRNKGVGRLMVLSGISSFLFGLLYGSAFGKEVFHPLLFSPMERIDLMLLTSLVVGVGVISLGFILRFTVGIRRNKIKDVLFGKEGVVYFLIYWLLVGIGIKLFVLEVEVTVDLVILALLILLLIIYGIKKEEKLTSPTLEVFRTILENLVNTLSFMRLGAFALAHGALFFAIFTIAESVKSIKGGDLIYWLILVLGNLLIVALEGLVVTIQALRLNYYEFFKKFFKGGGKPFKPFSLEEG